MSRPYTETQVLKKLDIPDFRHLTKDKVIAFATMVPKMNPEVAKKALEQFPDFASTSLEVMREYRGIIEEAMEDDRKSTQTCYDMYNRVMSALEKILNEDELSFDEKTYILSQMKDVADEVSRKDYEKANNRIKIISIAGSVAAAVVAILGSAIGTNLVSRQSSLADDDMDLIEK
ncbi:hypothetical protein LJB56_15275 [Lachnospiraceae bacterium 210521-DFI.3.101]|nr:hypothetical protein [Lachnospiraceae bacterium 210521-DFI.3.101]